MAKLTDFMVDKRVARRHMVNGTLDRKDYAAYLKDLPDREGNVEVVRIDAQAQRPDAQPKRPEVQLRSVEAPARPTEAAEEPRVVSGVPPAPVSPFNSAGLSGAGAAPSPNATPSPNANGAAADNSSGGTFGSDGSA